VRGYHYEFEIFASTENVNKPNFASSENVNKLKERGISIFEQTAKHAINLSIYTIEKTNKQIKTLLQEQ